MKIIGFSGGMGVGKSTAIKILEDLYPSHPVFLVKFAQPLYDIQEAVYDRISSVYSRPSDFKKDRKLLQWLGTDWGRDTISNTLWVDLWKASVEEVKRDHVFLDEPIIVCDDVRFDNEAETLKELGGYVIKLVRPNNTAHAEGGQGIVNHKSESGISENLLDFVVYNNDNLDTFRDRLIACFQELYKPTL